MRTHDRRQNTFPMRLHQAFDGTSIKAGRSRVTEVSIRFGVSRETARLWFAGAAMPELARLIEITDFCMVNLDWLARSRGPMKFRPMGDMSEEAADYGQSLADDERAVLMAMRSMKETRRRALVDLLT